VDAKLDFGVARVQVGEPRHQPFLQEGGEGADVDGAALALLPEALQGRFELIESAPDPGQQPHSFGSKLHVAPVTAEKRRLQVVLERLDLLAHGGRRDVQRLGGCAEIEPGGHGLEHAQRIQRQSIVGGVHRRLFLAAVLH